MAPRTLHQAMAYLGLAEQAEPVRDTRSRQDLQYEDRFDDYQDTQDVHYDNLEVDYFDDSVEDDFAPNDRYEDSRSSFGSVREGSVREEYDRSSQGSAPQEYSKPASSHSADTVERSSRTVLHEVTPEPRSKRPAPTGPLAAVTPLEPRVTSAAPKTPQTPSSTTESEEELRRITTIHPRSYNDAKIIGESFRENIPVIMNVTDMGDSEAKRLVDFSAGLAFALHGSIERVTDKVFLLTPANLEVLGAEGAEVPVALDSEPSDLFDQD